MVSVREPSLRIAITVLTVCACLIGCNALSDTDDGVHILSAADPGPKDSRLGDVLTSLQRITAATSKSAAAAITAAAAAQDKDPVKKVTDMYIHASDLMEENRRMQSQTQKEENRNAKLKMEIAKRARGITASVAASDARAVHARVAALRDLRRAEKIEQMNAESNRKIDALEHQVAEDKFTKQKLKQKIKKVHAEATSKVKKQKLKRQNLAKKMKAVQNRHQTDKTKMRKIDRKVRKEEQTMAVKETNAKSQIRDMKQQKTAGAALQKAKLLQFKQAMAETKKDVQLDQAGIKKTKQLLLKANRKAKRQAKAATKAKAQTMKGLVKAQVVASGLQRVKSLQDIMDAQRAKLATDTDVMVKRKIDIRFQKMKHETGSERKADATARLKKRGQRKAKRQSHNLKRKLARQARAKMRHLKAKAKAKYKLRIQKAKKTEKAKEAKDRSSQRLMAKAQKTIMKAAKAAQKELKAPSAAQAAAQQHTRRKEVQSKYLKKAKIAISKEFEKQNSKKPVGDLL